MLNELKEFHKVCKLINNHIMFDSLLSYSLGEPIYLRGKNDSSSLINWNSLCSTVHSIFLLFVGLTICFQNFTPGVFGLPLDLTPSIFSPLFLFCLEIYMCMQAVR